MAIKYYSCFQTCEICSFEGCFHVRVWRGRTFVNQWGRLHRLDMRLLTSINSRNNSASNKSRTVAAHAPRTCGIAMCDGVANHDFWGQKWSISAALLHFWARNKWVISGLSVIAIICYTIRVALFKSQVEHCKIILISFEQEWKQGSYTYINPKHTGPDPPMCLTGSWDALLTPNPVHSICILEASTQLAFPHKPWFGAFPRIFKLQFCTFPHILNTPRVSKQLEAAVPRIVLNLQVMYSHGIKKMVLRIATKLHIAVSNVTI